MTLGFPNQSAANAMRKDASARMVTTQAKSLCRNLDHVADTPKATRLGPCGSAKRTDTVSDLKFNATGASASARVPFYLRHAVTYYSATTLKSTGGFFKNDAGGRSPFFTFGSEVVPQCQLFFPKIQESNIATERLCATEARRQSMNDSHAAGGFAPRVPRGASEDSPFLRAAAVEACLWREALLRSELEQTERELEAITQELHAKRQELHEAWADLQIVEATLTELKRRIEESHDAY